MTQDNRPPAVRLIQIRDADDAEYDAYIIIPDDMPEKAALDLVDWAMHDAEQDEDDPRGKLNENLEKCGFVFPEITVARRDWS